MTQVEMIKLIELTILQAHKHFELGHDPMVNAAIDALTDNLEKVRKTWPLDEADQKTYLGMHATRNLLPNYTELSDQLMKIDYFARNPSQTDVPKLA